MASVLIGDGVTDVASSFDDDDVLSYIRQIQLAVGASYLGPHSQPNFTVASVTALGFLLPDTLESSIATYMLSLQEYAYDDGNYLTEAVNSVTFTGGVIDREDTLSASIGVENGVTGDLADSPDTLVSAIAISATATADVVDGPDTLAASLVTVITTDITASLVDSPDTVQATAGITLDATGVVTDGPDAIVASLAVTTTVNLSASLVDRPDTLEGDLDSPFYLNASLNFDSSFWNTAFVWGEDVWGPGTPQNDRLIATLETGPVVNPPNPTGQQSPGDIRPKAPKYMYVFVRPKVERDLDDILEVIDTVQETDRVSENKRKLRVARQALKAVVVPPDYTKAMAGISAALDRVTRSTAKHEGLKQSLAMVSIQLEAVIASLQEKRKKRQREEEELLTWLF